MPRLYRHVKLNFYSSLNLCCTYKLKILFQGQNALKIQGQFYFIYKALHFFNIFKNFYLQLQMPKCNNRLFFFQTNQALASNCIFQIFISLHPDAISNFGRLKHNGFLYTRFLPLYNSVLYLQNCTRKKWFYLPFFVSRIWWIYFWNYSTGFQHSLSLLHSTRPKSGKKIFFTV